VIHSRGSPLPNTSFASLNEGLGVVAGLGALAAGPQRLQDGSSDADTATWDSGAKPCSTNTSFPPGFRTRRISISAATGFGIEHKVQVITMVSKSALANGVAPPNL
jgi:hypothetical protein